MAEEKANMRHALKVYFDIDGVVFPWDQAAREAFSTHRGYDNLIPSQYWNHLKDQVRSDDWAWLWRGPGIKKVFDRPDLFYPGAPSALRSIGAVTDLSFITHRPPTAAEFTARWIAAQRCVFTSLHVLGMHVPKSDVAHDADVVIDDKPEVVYDFLENTNAHVFVPRRDYNEELWRIDDEPRLTMFTQLKEVTQWVRARTQRSVTQ